MSETLTQRLLAAVFDDKAIGDDLVRDLALSSDAHGELVRLAAVLARLPGDGARAAELRLDSLLDDVSLVAASESRAPSAGSDAMRRSAPRAGQRLRNIKRLLPASVAVAASVVVIVIAWSSHEAGVTTSRLGSDSRPTPAPLAPPMLAPPAAPTAQPPPVGKRALVDVEIRVSPQTAEISIDGKAVGGTPFSGQYSSDGIAHRIRVDAAGYISKQTTVVFDTSVTLDLSLERSELVAVTPPAREPSSPPAPAANSASARPAMPQPAPPAMPSAARQAMPEVAPVPASPGRALDPALDADALYSLAQQYYELHDYAAALSTLERWLAGSGATAAHRHEVEQTIAALQLRVGRVMIATNLPDCKITIDDILVGNTPLHEPLLVNVGRRKVTVMREGYSPRTRFVDVAAAGTMALELWFAEVNAASAAGGRSPVRPIDPANPYVGPP